VVLPLAEMAAFFQATEIKKAKIHRFFYFEDKRGRNEHPRNVGLKHVHVRRPVRIRRRRFEKGDQLLLTGPNGPPVILAR